MGESKFPAPGLYLSDQLSSIESGSHRPPIVGTPSPDGARWDGRWLDETGTAHFAQRLAASPAITNATLTLAGDLGAGKTTFVRHLLRALGVQGRIKSPTYAVVEPHEAPGLNIWHFDFYRFNDPREWEDAGFRDVFASPGLKLAEWPEKAAALIPAADVAIFIEALDEEARRVTLHAHTPLGQQLLQGLHP